MKGMRYSTVKDIQVAVTMTFNSI